MSIAIIIIGLLALGLILKLVKGVIKLVLIIVLAILIAGSLATTEKQSIRSETTSL